MAHFHMHHLFETRCVTACELAGLLQWLTKIYPVSMYHKDLFLASELALRALSQCLTPNDYWTNWSIKGRKKNENGASLQGITMNSKSLKIALKNWTSSKRNCFTLEEKEKAPLTPSVSCTSRRLNLLNWSVTNVVLTSSNAPIRPSPIWDSISK